jgi:hypothetical protein
MASSVTRYTGHRTKSEEGRGYKLCLADENLSLDGIPCLEGQVTVTRTQSQGQVLA